MSEITINGITYGMVEVTFKPREEPWSTYQLVDGSEVRMKLVVQRVFNVLGLYDPSGNPSYHFEIQTLSVVDVPDNLKKKER